MPASAAGTADNGVTSGFRQGRSIDGIVAALQKPVACRMIEGVVDHLGTIQVDKQHRKRFVTFK
jgi:hypothetical protein